MILWIVFEQLDYLESLAFFPGTFTFIQLAFLASQAAFSNLCITAMYLLQR